MATHPHQATGKRTHRRTPHILSHRREHPPSFPPLSLLAAGLLCTARLLGLALVGGPPVRARHRAAQKRRAGWCEKRGVGGRARRPHGRRLSRSRRVAIVSAPTVARRSLVTRQPSHIVKSTPPPRPPPPAPSSREGRQPHDAPHRHRSRAPLTRSSSRRFATSALPSTAANIGASTRTRRRSARASPRRSPRRRPRAS